MLLNDNDNDLIQKFVDDCLSDQEAVLFNERMKDHVFFKEAKLQKSLADFVNSHHRLQMKARFKEKLSKLKVEDHDDKYARRWYWLAAAVVFVVVLSYMYFLPSATTPETLFSVYYKPFPVESNLRGEQSSGLAGAIEFYKNRNYREAVQSLEAVLPQLSESEKLYVTLILGSCYVELGNTTQASRLFDTVRNSKEVMIAQHADWYYTLLLLRQKEVSRALQNCRKIISLHSLYEKQATSLADELEGLN